MATSGPIDIVVYIRNVRVEELNLELKLEGRKNLSMIGEMSS